MIANAVIPAPVAREAGEGNPESMITDLLFMDFGLPPSAFAEVGPRNDLQSYFAFSYG